MLMNRDQGVEPETMCLVCLTPGFLAIIQLFTLFQLVTDYGLINTHPILLVGSIVRTWSELFRNQMLSIF